MEPKPFTDRLEMLLKYHSRLIMLCDDLVRRVSDVSYNTPEMIEAWLRRDPYFRELTTTFKSDLSLNSWQIQQTIARATDGDSFFFYTRENGWELINGPPVINMTRRYLWFKRNGNGAVVNKLLGVGFQEENKNLRDHSKLIGDIRHEIASIRTKTRCSELDAPDAE